MEGRKLVNVENISVQSGPHHERWLYMLIHTLWRRGMRAFRGMIHQSIVALIRTWIRIVHKVNQSLRKRFPHLSYLFGERILAKHYSEVEASDFIKEIKAHQEVVRGESTISKVAEPVIEQVSIETPLVPTRKPRKRVTRTKDVVQSIDSKAYGAIE